jgi:hypothetical protein
MVSLVDMRDSRTEEKNLTQRGKEAKVQSRRIREEVTAEKQRSRGAERRT